jgi:benzoyl-CoA 2,3-dioxygenase component B
MLTEEAHHMFVGETGVSRIVQRTAEVMRQKPDADPREQGVIDLPTLQKYMNYWYSISLDLFGSEISSNAASYFASGLKGRAHEDRYEDHVALAGSHELSVPQGEHLVSEAVPLRNAMNEILRGSYIDDSQRGIDKFNKVLDEHGIAFRLSLPSTRFNRQVGVYAGHYFTPEGERVGADEWQRRRNEWLPTDTDEAYIKSLMSGSVLEPGMIANWIAPPRRGIKGRPVEFEYVRFD